MYKRRLFYVALFVAILIFTDVIIGLLSNNLIKKQTKNDFGTVNKILADNTELLVLGSSRAQNHYNSALMANILNQPVYNGGVAGMGTAFYYALAKERINNGSLKTLIIDVAPNVLADIDQSDKLHNFYPLVNIYPSFQQLLLENYEEGDCFKKSALIKYNSTLYDIISELVSSSKSVDAFTPLHGEIAGQESFFYESNPMKRKEIANQLSYLKKTILDVRNSGVKVFLVISPSFKDFDKEKIITQMIASLALNEGVRLFDFGSSEKYRNRKDLFYNQLHLNEMGSNLFTSDLCDSLRSELMNN